MAEQSFFESANDGVVKIDGGNTVVGSDGVLISMSRNLTLTVQVDG